MGWGPQVATDGGVSGAGAVEGRCWEDRREGRAAGARDTVLLPAPHLRAAGPSGVAPWRWLAGNLVSSSAAHGWSSGQDSALLKAERFVCGDDWELLDHRY